MPDKFQHLIAKSNELGWLGDIYVFCSADGYCFKVLVSHNSSKPQPASTAPVSFYGSEVDAILTSKANGDHLGPGLLQLLADKFHGLIGALALEMGCVSYLHLIIVYPEVDQIGGLPRMITLS